MTRCNWFWASHGCDLDAGHDGYHLCGTDDVPCCRHDGSRMSYYYYQYREFGHWSNKWVNTPGFCSPITGEGDPKAPCADPTNCKDRDEAWHDDPMRLADLFIEDLESYGNP